VLWFAVGCSSQLSQLLYIILPQVAGTRKGLEMVRIYDDKNYPKMAFPLEIILLTVGFSFDML
jgi:hypothetical protein